jgi:hypothetical protein
MHRQRSAIYAEQGKTQTQTNERLNALQTFVKRQAMIR